MTIIPASAPAGLTQRAAAEAAAVGHARLSAEATAEAGGAGQPRASDPLPIYSVPLAALADDPAAFDHAQQHGWRVLTEDASGRHLVDFAASQPTRATSIHRAGAADLLVRASLMASAGETDDALYELRMLDLGRLGVRALWLHSEEAPDRFFTIEATPREQTTEQMLAAVSPRARRRLNPNYEGGGAASFGLESELGG